MIFARHSFLRNQVAALAFVLAVSVPTFAAAHSIEDAQVELELKILGKVSPKCELSVANPKADVILTEKAGSTSVPFLVDCNQRMNVRIRSLNGGMQHSEVGRDPRFAGFVNFVPYTASFKVDVEGARIVAADSQTMTSPVEGSVGLIPHQTTGALSLAWNATPPLLGGLYLDVIEIRVSGD